MWPGVDEQGAAGGGEGCDDLEARVLWLDHQRPSSQADREVLFSRERHCDCWVRKTRRDEECHMDVAGGAGRGPTASGCLLSPPSPPLRSTKTLLLVLGGRGVWSSRPGGLVGSKEREGREKKGRLAVSIILQEKLWDITLTYAVHEVVVCWPSLRRRTGTCWDGSEDK